MFYIGQKVVAIKDHSQGRFKEGDEFTVLNVMQAYCKCTPQMIDIGFGLKGNLHCQKCNRDGGHSNTHWFACQMFAPLESYRESFSIAMELVQEMEQVDKQKVFNPKKIEACITTPTPKQAEP